MSDWIENPFKSIIGGTAIIFLAVGALTMGIAVLGSIV